VHAKLRAISTPKLPDVKAVFNLKAYYIKKYIFDPIETIYMDAKPTARPAVSSRRIYKPTMYKTPTAILGNYDYNARTLVTP